MYIEAGTEKATVEQLQNAMKQVRGDTIGYNKDMIYDGENLKNLTTLMALKPKDFVYFVRTGLIVNEGNIEYR